MGSLLLKFNGIKLLMGLIAPLILLSSCSQILSSIYGINLRQISSEKYDLKNVENSVSKDRLNPEQVYYIDSLFFDINSIDSIYKEKNHTMIQPLQVHIVNNNLEKLQTLINCHFQGFPNINFNKYDALEVLPNLTDVKLNDIAYPITDVIKHISKLNGSEKLVINRDKKYSIFVFYLSGMGRQKKRLFKQINNLTQKYDPTTYNLYYVNLDYMYVKIHEMDLEKQKKK